MIIAVLVIIADFVTKLMVMNRLPFNESVELIPGLLDFTYVKNTGSAWGMMSDKSVLLTGIVIALILGLIVYIIKAKPKKWERISLYLIIAGGLGNLISRFVYGYVIDFIDIHIIPIFNLADISICVGCALLMLALFVLEKDD